MRKLTIEQLNNRIQERFPGEQLEIIKYERMKDPFSIKCLHCGTIYNFASAENFFLKKRGCPKCCDTPEWAQQKQRFKEWLKDHSEFELVEDLNEVHDSQAHIKCRCTLCGRIQENKTVYNYYDGKKCFCQTKSIKKPQDQIENDYKDICVFLEPYINTDKPVLVQSKICGHSFKVRPCAIFRDKYYCPICKSSKGEKRILFWLESKKVPYERQKQMIIEKRLVKIDFFLPEQNLYIEYNGAQHYRPVEHFGGIGAFEQQKTRDELVRKYIKEINGNLLEIPYTEFNQIEKILEREVRLC